VDFHVPQTQSTWTPKNASYVISPGSWCEHPELDRRPSFDCFLCAHTKRPQNQMYALEHTSRSPGKSRSLSSELGKFSLRELYALAHTAYRNTALHGEKKELSDRVRVETHQETHKKQHLP